MKASMCVVCPSGGRSQMSGRALTGRRLGRVGLEGSSTVLTHAYQAVQDNPACRTVRMENWSSPGCKTRSLCWGQESPDLQHLGKQPSYNDTKCFFILFCTSSTCILTSVLTANKVSSVLIKS